MLPVDRERTITMNMNLVVLVAGGFAVALALVVVDFTQHAIVGSLLILIILVLVAGAVTSIANQIWQRQRRLKAMAQYGALAKGIVQRAKSVGVKHMGVRQRQIVAEIAEIFAVMYGRITGERCWVSVRQVYTDGNTLFIHDVLHPSNFKGGVASELNDLEGNAAFRAIWGRVRQANHPYYVCSHIEREWKGKIATMSPGEGQMSWPEFYRSLIAYLGPHYAFSYQSVAVIPIGGGPGDERAEDDSRITPWGYIAILSDSPRAFSDPAVRDLGRRCSHILSDLLTPASKVEAAQQPEEAEQKGPPQ